MRRILYIWAYFIKTILFVGLGVIFFILNIQDPESTTPNPATNGKTTPDVYNSIWNSCLQMGAATLSILMIYLQRDTIGRHGENMIAFILSFATFVLAMLAGCGFLKPFQFHDGTVAALSFAGNVCSLSAASVLAYFVMTEEKSAAVTESKARESHDTTHA